MSDAAANAITPEKILCYQVAETVFDVLVKWRMRRFVRTLLMLH